MAIARVRFYDVGDVVALDVNWQPIPGLVYRGPVRKAAPEVKRILAAARAQGGVILQEQAWGRFLPLTENTLAVFEGRAPVGDRTRAVEL
jgi:hypothetical protein